MAKKQYQNSYDVIKNGHNELAVTLTAQYILNDTGPRQDYTNYLQRLPPSTLKQVHVLVEKKSLIDNLKNEILLASDEQTKVSI